MKCQYSALLILVALIVSVVVPVTLVSAENTNETNICEYSYYFIIGHLQTGNVFSYSISDLDGLKTDLLNEKSIDVGNVSELKPYVENYTEICGTETPDLVLPPIIFDVGKIEILQDNEFICDSYINKTFMGFYDMDWSIPFFKIHKGIINCGATQFWKWFLNYEKTGKYDYSVTGIKLWWIILSFLISIIVIYYRINHKINEVIARESERG